MPRIRRGTTNNTRKPFDSNGLRTKPYHFVWMYIKYVVFLRTIETLYVYASSRTHITIHNHRNCVSAWESLVLDLFNFCARCFVSYTPVHGLIGFNRMSQTNSKAKYLFQCVRLAHLLDLLIIHFGKLQCGIFALCSVSLSHEHFCCPHSVIIYSIYARRRLNWWTDYGLKIFRLIWVKRSIGNIKNVKMTEQNRKINWIQI